MLKHVVAVTLNYAKDDPKVAEFFAEAQRLLTQIPELKSYRHYAVQNWEHCNYDYGFILEFDSAEGLDAYCKNPYHIEFAEGLWAEAVKSVVDINFIPMD